MSAHTSQHEELLASYKRANPLGVRGVFGKTPDPTTAQLMQHRYELLRQALERATLELALAASNMQAAQAAVESFQLAMQDHDARMGFQIAGTPTDEGGTVSAGE